MTNLLFVYGTLLQADNDFALYLRANCKFISFGTTPGQLYDLGEYPGLVETNQSNQLVYGSVYQMQNPFEVLKQLDFYEGVGPDEEQPNLYRRELADINTEKGTITVWVYVYNRSVGNAPLIPDGDYIKYLNKKSPG
ncbi:gamma-glutamylcyclotransferase [Mucilaginibacter conchicola]|uniref:Gamma-glutamylcyclotransferase n=1 Tax=Mucilaginibacter conchicola TaxID=2303333 RepID=A0A372NVD2_9SPHI|nr:gamma-glutamylcyclotransferase family protein [Mucilaginibacter conchicola]RFZ94088.1 gamma-glutamylcyclotransferase [Mucilaginibacter conchicola]